MPRSSPSAPHLPCAAGRWAAVACAGWLLVASEASTGAAQKEAKAPDKKRRSLNKYIKEKASEAVSNLKRQRRPSKRTPLLQWGDLVSVTGFADRATEPWIKLAPLWEEKSLNAVVAAFSEIPMQVGLVSTSDYIIESRLVAANDIIDYSIKLHPEDFAAYSRNPRVQEWASTSPQWRYCADFMKTFSLSGFHSEVWMEFDQSTGPAAPSVFVAPLNWIRTLLMVSELTKIAGSRPSLDEALDLVEPFLMKIWSPFWSAMPWLNQTQHEVRRRLVEVLLLADDRFSVYQLGFWLARDTGTVRLVLEEEGIYDHPEWWKNTTRWWAGLKEPLVDLGWRWTDDDRPNLLDEYMPKLLVGISHTYPAINIMAGGVTAKIGFEMYFDGSVVKEIFDEHGATKVDKTSRPRPKPFLDALVEMGLCSPEKRVAALDGGIGGTNDDGFKFSLQAGDLSYRARILTNHIKVTFEPGKPVEAKLYTAVRHKWMNSPRSKRKQANDDDEL